MSENNVQFEKNYIIRRLEKKDIDYNYVHVLSNLTTVGDVSKKKFLLVLNFWNSNPDHYHPIVITNTTGIVIATGMLLIEQKLIHNCGLVGHIEDISVEKIHQGKGIGKKIVNHLINLAKERKCYKVILNCKSENIAFYEKCGFTHHDNGMSLKFNVNL